MTAPERIRVVVTDAEVVGPFPDGDDRATNFVRADLYATLAAKYEALERERDDLNTTVAGLRAQTTRLMTAEARVRSLEEAQDSGSLFLMDLIRRHADALTAEDEVLQARLLNLIREFRWAFPKAEPALRARYSAALSDTPREEPTP